MSNVENIIAQLQELHGSEETMNVLSEAISLLRKSEPVKPIEEYYADGWLEYYCGKCRHFLTYSRDNQRVETEYAAYCAKCGQAVDWNEEE